MHKFHLGQTVSYHVPRGIDAPRGAYVLMAKLPERDGEFEYRILSALEGHHRTARESELQPRSEVEAAPVEKVNRRPGGTASVDFTRLHFQHSRDMFAGYLVKRWWEDQRMRRRAIIILVLMAATMLTGCGSARFSPCDPTNIPGANCYQQQGPPYRN